MELTRRRFLEATVVSAAAVAAGVSLANLDLGPFTVKKVEAAQTSTQWNLQVTNMTDDTVNYTFDQFLAMPATEVSADLYCDEALLAEGNWSGVSLGYLLQKAGLDPKVDSVRFKAQDGYSINIPLSEALNPNVIVAYEKDDTSLPEVLRLVVPGEIGEVWIDMIASISMISSTANSGQNVGSPTSPTEPYSTQQQEPGSSPSQPASLSAGTSVEPVASPADAAQCTWKTSTTREFNLGGPSIPAVLAEGVMLAAAVGLMAAGYVTRMLGHESRK